MQVSKESFCNNKAHVITIDNIVIYYSYETIIGVMSDKFTGRSENFWGPTSGKHFNQLGIADFPIVTIDEIGDFLNSVKVAS